MSDLKTAELALDALAYVTLLYEELTTENGAPMPGTQNQVVEFICGNPKLAEYVRDWARRTNPHEAHLEPPQRLPQDEAYVMIRAELERDLAERA